MKVSELIAKLEEIENKDLEVMGCGRDDWDDVTKVSIEVLTLSDQITKTEYCELKIGDWH